MVFFFIKCNLEDLYKHFKMSSNTVVANLSQNSSEAGDITPESHKEGPKLWTVCFLGCIDWFLTGSPDTPGKCFTNSLVLFHITIRENK